MTTKQRLYFTDPIVALYMMREFGVKCEVMYDGENYCDLEDYGVAETENVKDLLQHFIDHPRVYVKVESESIFEPKLFDRGWNREHEAPLVYESINYQGQFGWTGTGHYHGLYKDSEVEITMRYNKQFFQALNEDV